ncbi:MAG TPA: GlsB/YeaQ/YmgE family stress response membrane protein [Pseudonocardiaceae bacterium]|nr:GlsB/YeaQ/YmgE family stress response membrane protein [Pseudonocardiaceae bacterium]
MGLLGWIVFGALAGWAANVIIGGRDRQGQGCLANIVVGVVGAVLGGLLYRIVTGREISFEFDLPSFGIAVLGAVVLLGTVRLLTSASRTPR